METLIVAIAVVIALLYAAWTRIRDEHLIPVLIRALQHIDEKFDSVFECPITSEHAQKRLKEIRQYQGRLWVFTDPEILKFWDERLTEIAQGYEEVIDATEPKGIVEKSV